MTLLDFLQTYKEEIGFDETHCSAISYINKGLALIYPMGDYKGLVGYSNIKPLGRCFYLPYNIETAKKAFTGCRNIKVENLGFCQVTDDFCSCGCEKKELVIVKTQEYKPLPIDEFDKGVTYGFKSRSSIDNGKTITVVYVDRQFTERKDVLKLNSKSVSKLSNSVFSIKSIHKEQTAGAVDFVSIIGKTESKIHMLFPRELVPMYSRYSLSGCICDCISIFGKKRFIPFQDSIESLSEDLGGLNPYALMLAIKANNNLSGEKQDLNYYQYYVKLLGDFLKQEKKDNNTSSTGTKQVDWPVEIPLNL